jgi:lysophospholipase L1-like esterase
MLRGLVFLTVTLLTLPGCGKGLEAASALDATSSSGPTNYLMMASLGDSISRGTDINLLGQEDLADSWTTGASLPGSLMNLIGANTPAYKMLSDNFAVSGESVLGTASKFDLQTGIVASKGYDIVTVEIGADDVCNGHLGVAGSQTAFRDKLVSNLNLLVNSPNPPKIIALVSIPHIFALTQYPTLANSPICQAAWQLFCPNLQIGQAAFEAQWMAANQAISDAAAIVGGPVHFDNGILSGTAFTLPEVSTVDCFHPSIAGQTRIAAAIWPVIQNAVAAEFTPHN